MVDDDFRGCWCGIERNLERWSSAHRPRYVYSHFHSPFHQTRASARGRKLSRLSRLRPLPRLGCLTA